MEPEISDPWLVAMVFGLALASIATWFALAECRKHGPLLAYEPRCPVPWRGYWTLLPILLVVLTLFAAIRGDDSTKDSPAPTTSDFVERLALGSAQQAALVVAFLAVVIAASGANRADLGLPKNARELARDVRIGFLTWLASLAPVYGVQAILIGVFGPSEGHPLIKMVEEHANPALFILAFLAAVLVAPICEELMFRLLLQGWFEKWEDSRLGWRTPVAPAFEVVEFAATNEIPVNAATSTLPLISEIEAATPDEPPQIGLAGLPYGWLPIVLSSLLFALAHVGYGPDPVPLFLLALMLGYVYQRTHRIVPSMVTHALFNGMSLFALWRVMSAGGH